jgi:hypothetical protein
MTSCDACRLLHHDRRRGASEAIQIDFSSWSDSGSDAGGWPLYVESRTRWMHFGFCLDLLDGPSVLV